MKADDLTDSEVDELLERFDQTEPRLQRRIIAQLVIDRERLRSALERLMAVVNPPDTVLVDEYDQYRQVMREARSALASNDREEGL